MKLYHWTPTGGSELTQGLTYRSELRIAASNIKIIYDSSRSDLRLIAGIFPLTFSGLAGTALGHRIQYCCADGGGCMIQPTPGTALRMLILAR